MAIAEIAAAAITGAGVRANRFVTARDDRLHQHRRVPFDVHLKPVETLVFRSDVVAFGTFRCPSSHSLFSDSGPCSHHTFVFPRSATSIRHEGGESFVATPNSVAFYNQHQRYTRSKISDADASDWFVIADDVLMDAVAVHDRAVADRPARPFRFAHVPVDARVYAAQRGLFDSAARLEAFEIEESVLRIFGRLLETAYGRLASVRHCDEVEEVKRFVAAAPERSPSLRELARGAGCSPYELCRRFRRETGFTLTQFRHSLRLRIALERLRTCDDITGLALDLGYSSHSHFTWAFRRCFGMPPSRFRATT